MGLVVKQLDVKGYDDNFSYVVYHKELKECIVIDPTGDYDIIDAFIKKEKLKVLFIVNTHGHHDHIDGNDYFKTKYAADVIVHELAKQKADVLVKDGDEIQVGNQDISILFTPGHSPDSICLLFGKDLICGDLVFASGTGRTDLDGSNPSQFKRSLGKIFRLDEEIKVWPGHNYGGKSTTIKKIKEELLGY
tara:strand:- start:844 stop:1416 length:573 start_codon:yes stop_codon:yes gene_type:complete